MVQANDVAGTRAALKDGLDPKFREVHSVLNEISKKGIPGSERKKSQGGSAFCLSIRKKSVDDLEAGSVAAHGNELAEPIRIRAAGLHGGLSGSTRFTHFKL